MFDGLINYFKNKRLKREANFKKSILIVDDSELERTLIRNIVTRRNYRVLLARDGSEGLNIARQERPDMILLDCEMPVMTGLEMCKKLKEDSKFSDIPVVFITSNDTPRNVIECFEADCANYLSKPINSRVLISQIESTLAEKSSKK